MQKKNKKSRPELFIELAKPNKNGESDWVEKTRFTGIYKRLYFKNGFDWGRTGVIKGYRLEVERKDKKNNGEIIKIRLAGFAEKKKISQYIPKEIREKIKGMKCVMLGVGGDSKNTTIEVDHKDGRKQKKVNKLEDFQPLCKAANDIKREICKKCEENNIRWDAKNISGNPYSFYEGDQHYNPQLGCVGCYQYDPVAYRIASVHRLCKEASNAATEFIIDKLYPELKDKTKK